MNHLEKIKRAIDYIECHLNVDLLIDDIAQEAHFSRWHFQMIFNSTVGDTVKEYIRKRRLSEALMSLADDQNKIIDVALAAGFESQESFTRAFKNYFGLNPAECRKKGIDQIQYMKKKKITMDYLDHLYKGVNMEPIFKNVETFTVAGFGNRFISVLSEEKNNHIVIPKLWNQFIPQQNLLTKRKSTSNFGVCFCLPKDERKHPEECYYIAGAEIDDNETLPTGMEKVTISSGKYAVFTHKGPLDEAVSNIGHTMNYIYGSWLPKSGCELRDAPDFELYDHRFHPTAENSEFDIYIPIK